MVAPSGLAQLRRGAIEHCVLALLDREERYGFDLVRELGEAGELVTSEGTINPLLSRLRRDGAGGDHLARLRCGAAPALLPADRLRAVGARRLPYGVGPLPRRGGRRPGTRGDAA